MSDLSMIYAAGIGANMQPTRRNATSQEASSRVIGIGEFSPKSIGIDGEVQPMPIATANILSVAKGIRLKS